MHLVLATSMVTSLGLISPQIAQATDDFADAAAAKVQYTRPTVSSTFDCHSLAGKQIGAATVTSAVIVPATSSVPAYCDVSAVIAPSNLINVALPLAWNQRLYGLGNGGCGGPLAAYFGQRNLGLANAFAVVTTDTGHEGNVIGCNWAANRPDLVVDFAYRGIHDAAVAAKDIIRIFYSRRPLFSYFNSCSDGGHDGMEEAQKYPRDYDGIVAGSPLLGAGNVIWVEQGYSSLPVDEQMTPAKVNYIASTVYAKCDALDGVKDGIITDPRICGRVFNPDRDLKRCARGTNGSDCLTEAQLRAYEHMLTPVISRGEPIFPQSPLGVEPELVGNQIPSPGTTFATGSLNYILAQAYAKYLFPWPRTNPSEFTVENFNFNTDPSRILPFRRMFDPTVLQSNAFFARGGKLLSYHGWADPLLTPYGTVAFYEDEMKLYGKALPSFYQLYMVPGMAHCAGGPGADGFDPVTKIVDWVEAHVEPGDILSRHFDPTGTQVQFTRKLCDYPRIAYYVGGKSNSADSYRCGPGPLGVPGTGPNDGLQLP